ncbi:MAG TPA: energy transducer TonB [Sunxiuqinia sp.]|nr:energy transducer TonB [Sunxiuqinia sp.]
MEQKKTPKADLENKRSIFLSTGLVLALSFVLFAFSWETPAEKVNEFDDVNWDAPEDIIIPLTSTEKKKIMPPVKLVPEIKLVDDDTEFDEPDLDVFDTEITNEGIKVNKMVGDRDKENIDDEKVYLSVPEMPEFPGGKKALLHFIATSIDYPVVAVENGIHGTVYVSFVVNNDGMVSNVAVVRGVDPALNHEALRVVNSLPRWKPGRQSGKAVRVAFTVPIKFVLQ